MKEDDEEEKEKKQDDKEEDDIKSAGTKVRRQSTSKVFPKNKPNHAIKVYAMIDEQSYASMIGPQLAKEPGIDRPKERYSLSTCSGSKETRYGRRVQGLVVKSTQRRSKKLPTRVECDNIPRGKREIPTPELIAKFDHIGDIAKKFHH